MKFQAIVICPRCSKRNYVYCRYLWDDGLVRKTITCGECGFGFYPLKELTKNDKKGIIL